MCVFIPHDTVTPWYCQSWSDSSEPVTSHSAAPRTRDRQCHYLPLHMARQDRTKQHEQFYSWHYTDTHTHTLPSTHRGLSRIKEWRPQTRWLVILRCFESACVSITHPGQQEPLWPHPAHQCWAEESWSFSWKLPSDRDGETGEERGRRNVTRGAKTTKGRCNILV